MARDRPALLSFNRGLVSRLALARTDLTRMALSAARMVNWMPRLLGSMMLRPGLGYIGATYQNAAAKQIPFVFATDDTALVEVTGGTLRVRVNDTVVTRGSVSTAIRGGTFDSDVTQWNKVSDPATIPGAQVNAIAFSPDGTLMAVGGGTGANAFIYIYSISGTTLTKLTGPASLPTGTAVYGASFSPDGAYLAICGDLDTGKQIMIYSVTGTGASATFTLVAQPASVPNTGFFCCAYSPDGTYLALGRNSATPLLVYSVAAGVLTACTGPVSQPAGNNVRGVAWSQDNGKLVAVSDNSGATPTVTCYALSGQGVSTTFTGAVAGTAPAGIPNGVAFSRNGSWVAVAHATTPFVTVYSVSGTALTKITNPGTLPASTGSSCAFSPDSQFLAVAHTTTPFVTIYDFATGAPVKVTNPGTLPDGNGQVVRFSPNAQILAVGHTTTQFMTLYEAYQWLDRDDSGAVSAYGSGGATTAVAGPTTPGTQAGVFNNYTIRQRIDTSLVSVTSDRVRVTFSADGAGTFMIDKAYIGHAAAAGDAYDFESAPTQLTFSGGSAGFTITNAATIASDDTSFVIDPTKSLIIAFHVPSSAADDFMRQVTNAGWRAYYKAGDDTTTVNTTGYTTSDAVFGVYQVDAIIDSAAAASGYLSLTGTDYNRARRTQIVSISDADLNVEHALRIVIARGVVKFRIGTTYGGEEVLAEATLTEGTHSLAFTPTASPIFFDVAATTQYATLLDSITVESSGDMLVAAPWIEADLQYLRWAQSGDVIFVACKGRQQYKIERRGTHSWSVVKYLPEDGPYRVENVNSLITMTPSAITGDITIAASQPFFRAGMVGGLLRITSIGQTVTASVTAQNIFTSTIKVTGVGDDRSFTVTRSGTWVATVTLQRSLIEPGAWTDVASYTTNATTTFTDGLDNQVVYYRIGVKTGGFTSGTAVLTLAYASGGLDGVARISDYTSSILVFAHVLQAFGGTTASEDWAEGLWSDYRGWPSAVDFFDGRLNWAGKDRYIGSVSDAFDSFDPETEGDSGPINRSIGEGPVDTINWLLPGQRQILGGQGAEISARSSSLDEPLTPTQFGLKPLSTQGSAALPAVLIDTVGIFVGRSGTRVFQISPNADAYDAYSTVDLTSIVPDLCTPEVVAVAVQRNPDTRIHCVLSDGTVAVLLFDENEDTRCWLKLETTGTVEDVVVLPSLAGVAEDAVYYTVNRTVSGATVRYLEKWALESECIGGTLNRQADAFVTFTQAPSATVTGLSHLEGLAVVCWANGKCMRDTDGSVKTFTVTAGAISLTNNGIAFPATSGVVGLGYTAQFQSTKLAYAAGDGTALTQRKKLRALGIIAADMHAKGLKYGGDFTTMRSMPEKEQGKNVDPDYIWTDYDEPMFSLDGVWDSDSRLCLQAQAPRPVTLLAAIIDMETKPG